MSARKFVYIQDLKMVAHTFSIHTINNLRRKCNTFCVKLLPYGEMKAIQIYKYVYFILFECSISKKKIQQRTKLRLVTVNNRERVA